MKIVYKTEKEFLLTMMVVDNFILILMGNLLMKESLMLLTEICHVRVVQENCIKIVMQDR